jgi:hypothetical protein
MGIKGIYRDELTDTEGRVAWRSGWRPNVIVASCDRLLAALMKREAGVQGILYWALGTGDAGWDASPPEASPAASKLATEVARRQLLPEQIGYVDQSGAPSAIPTSRLEITAEFRGDDLAPETLVPLREFGLFGGDATLAADTGLMVDYVIHPRIDLGGGLILRRTVRLSFTSGAPLDGGDGFPISFGASLPVIVIDGVGEDFGAQLSASGVATLGDLVRIDPLASVGDIPRVRLLEFRAKARLALGLRVDLAPFVRLSDRSVSDLLRERPELLAHAARDRRVTTKDAVRLQEQLAPLQIAFDDAQLQQVTLGQLGSG